MYNYSPVGKYRYKHLPMGVANSPDIFHQKMNDLLHVFEFICAYIHDIYPNQRRLDKSHTEIRVKA